MIYSLLSGKPQNADDLTAAAGHILTHTRADFLKCCPDGISPPQEPRNLLFVLRFPEQSSGRDVFCLFCPSKWLRSTTARRPLNHSLLCVCCANHHPSLSSRNAECSFKQKYIRHVVWSSGEPLNPQQHRVGSRVFPSTPSTVCSV